MDNLYYHVQLDLIVKSEKEHKKVRIKDLSKEVLIDKIIKSYEEGEIIFINGMGINPYEIERIHIRVSLAPYRFLQEIIDKEQETKRQKDMKSGFFDIYHKDDAFFRTDDVINEFINGIVGYKKEINKIELPNIEEDLQAKIIRLIRKSKIEDAFNLILSSCKDKSIRNEIILHSSRFEEIKQEERQGILLPNEAKIERNKIKLSLIELIDNF